MSTPTDDRQIQSSRIRGYCIRYTNSDSDKQADTAYCDWCISTHRPLISVSPLTDDDLNNYPGLYEVSFDMYYVDPDYQFAPTTLLSLEALHSSVPCRLEGLPVDVIDIHKKIFPGSAWVKAIPLREAINVATRYVEIANQEIATRMLSNLGGLYGHSQS